ncbi:hypothetical protein [Gracilibacillus alcaliphilus]|uniref:hypothetical protein n=1 Tax=Gracilibacillus alcaliphilus TaxID=1401441 RepID=UPI00195C0E5A|nr:hypothetical protein [Gracilibacillus alcaliphilus]MBM7675312.1 ABC-2 type transport system permease protein [Gracilibacillus alcaliphilus]
MINIWKADTFKLYKSTSPWVFIILSLVSTVIFVSCSHLVAAGELSIETATGALSLFSETQMMALLGSMAIGICISTDFENKIIENAISGGHSRHMIIINKIITFLLLITLLYLPYILSILILTFTDIEFSSFLPTPVLTILSASTQTEISAGLIGKLLLLSVLSLVIFISQLMVGIFYMFLFKKSVLVIAATYLTILILGPISSLNDAVHSVMAYTPYGIDLSQLTLDISSTFVGESLLISGCFILLLYLLTYAIFRKAEVK